MHGCDAEFALNGCLVKLSGAKVKLSGANKAHHQNRGGYAAHRARRAALSKEKNELGGRD